MSHLVYYHRDDETATFNAAVRDQMRRTSRERARKQPERIDWALLRRRAWEVVIMYVLIADLGLLLLAARDRQPVPMTFPADVTSTQAPHQTGEHP